MDLDVLQGIPRGAAWQNPASLTPAARGDAVAILSLGAMSWASHWHLDFPRFITWSSHTCAQGEFRSSCSGLSGLLCQKSCPFIAEVSVHKQAAGKVGLGHWQLVSSCWALGLHLLWSLGSFFPLWCFLGALLSMLCTYLGWGGFYLCHIPRLAVLVSNSQPYAVQFTESGVWSLKYSSQSSSQGSEIMV